MDLLLKGKKAIVTGGTRGIGLAIVETFLAEGAHVSFCARDKSNVLATQTRLANTIRKDSMTEECKVYGHALDIGDKNSIEPWLKTAIDEMQGLDILVLNAAAMVAANNEVDWQKNFMVDLMGAFRIIELVRPHLANAARKNGDAAVVAISSISGIEAHIPSSYGPIKGALIHYAKGMSRTLGEENIRINVVSPGPVYFKEGYWHQVEQQDPKGFKDAIDRTALKRLAKPKEIASSVVFLSSPLSASTTGENLVVDDGYTVRVPY